MPRQATLLVADEFYLNLHGKAVLHGIYPGDLIIPLDPSNAPQLIFYFTIETDISEPFKSLMTEITLPGAAPVRTPALVAFPLTGAEGQARLIYRQPVLIPGPTLRRGRIEAKVIHESGEIEVWAPSITLAQRVPKPN
jgi:hypothetical protein